MQTNALLLSEASICVCNTATNLRPSSSRNTTAGLEKLALEYYAYFFTPLTCNSNKERHAGQTCVLSSLNMRTESLGEKQEKRSFLAPLKKNTTPPPFLRGRS